MAKISKAFPEIASVRPTAKGEKNADLDHVQSFLCRFGYLAGRYDAGELGPDTQEALARYQAFHKLKVTGEFDEATRAQMTTHRCGVPDSRSGLEFNTTCSWNKTSISFAFDVGTADVAGNAEFQAVRNAFQTWAAAVPLAFTEVGVDDNPDIRIGWRPADDPDHSMVGSVLAHADFPPGCSVIVDELPLPIHFDDPEVNWVDGAVADSFDVETVALHEIGHTLGLLHSDVPGSVMFPSVSAGITKRALTEDDLQGIRSLYAAISRVGDSGSQAGFVSDIATVRHGAQQVVTAVRTSSNALRLISWRVNNDGSVTRTGDSGSAAGTASDLAIARGGKLVTACRTAAGKLKLISWNVDAFGAIARAGDSGDQAGEATRNDIVAMTGTLFLTACRTAGGDLKLISWRLNANASLSRLADSGSAAGAVSEISLLRLSSSRAVTSVRTANGSLKLIVWNVAADGGITRLGDSADQAGAASLIRSAVDGFGHVITAVRAAGGALKLISWQISGNGSSVTRLGDSGAQAGAIGDNALTAAAPGLISAVRDGSGRLKLISWTTTAAGAIHRAGDSGAQAGTASLITTCEPLAGATPIVTAVRTASNSLKLITWRAQALVAAVAA
jgi:hypothetical protein